MRGRSDASELERSLRASREAAPTRWDRAVEWILLVLLIFMPLAFGAVHAWSELVVLVLAGVMVLCLLLKSLLHPRAKLVWSWAYVPAAMVVVWVAVQAAPLPTDWVRLLAPHSASAHAQVTAGSAVTETMTVSLYPHATRRGLRLLLAATAVFFVTVNVFRTEMRIKRLLAGVVGIGAGVALMALVQVVAGVDRIYALVPVSRRVADAGPFLVPEHYGQFMCLCVGAALALLMVRLREAYGRRPVTLPQVTALISERGLRRLWYLPAVILLGAATVFATLNREAVMAALAAGVFTTLVMGAKYALKRSTWAMVAVTAGALLSVLYVGFDAVVERMGDASASVAASGGWGRFAVAGAGSGAMGTIADMVVEASSPPINEYARAVGEIGLVGLAPAVVLGGVIWGCYLRGVRRIRTPMQLASFGLGFGLFAVMMHSLSGSGLHTPAVASLTAVCCALLVNLHRLGRRPGWTAVPASVVWSRRAMRMMGLILTVGLWIHLLPEAGRAAAAEVHWRAAAAAEQCLGRLEGGDRRRLRETLLDHAGEAVRLQSANVRYRYGLAVYQLRDLYDATGPIGDRVLDAPTSTATREAVRRIVASLHAARTLCPPFGPACTLAGRLEWYVLGSPRGAAFIRMGRRLAPQNAVACFEVGRLEAQLGRWELSLRHFQRALRLDSRRFPAIAEIYLHVDVDRPDLALAVAGDDRRRLRRLVGMLDARRELSEPLRATRAQAAARLAGEKLLADVSHTQEPGDSGR